MREHPIYVHACMYLKPMVSPQCVLKMQLDETTMSEALLYDAHEVFMRNLSESYAGSAALCTLDSK